MDKSKLEYLFNSNKKPLILDGAMGSLLQQNGFKSDPFLWTCYLNFKNPKAVKEIHLKYAEAGADIITTNTFRTNPLVIEQSNYDIDLSAVVNQSVRIAKDITNSNNKILAGSNPPAEDCYQSERTVNIDKLISNHHRHIDLLFNAGVDIVLNETQSHFDEINITCDYCSKNNFPYLISLFITRDLTILSGEHVNDVIEFIQDYNPITILFNCIDKLTFDKLLDNVSLNFNWGFYLNCGSGNYNEKDISCGIAPDKYSDIVKSYLHLKPNILGSCCGSNPEHTKAIKGIIDGTFNS